MVPFVPLPPTYPKIPSETIPASPDPALAADLPPCRAGDLTITQRMGLALGTRGITVRIRGKAGVACRLEGYPEITLLDHRSPSACRLWTGPSSTPAKPVTTASRSA
jgi:Protein of unknown function (DUF4232)